MFWAGNEKVCSNEISTACYQNTGLECLCVLNCVIETPLTSLWSRQIITANTQFDVYEYVGDKY